MPPDRVPPEIVAPLIEPRPDKVGLPDPAMFPVKVKPPIFVAARVLTVKVAIDPLSARERSVFVPSVIDNVSALVMVIDGVEAENVMSSARVILPEPESIVTFPVVEPPSVKVCMLVVARFPAPVSKVALLLELAEIVAVGVPEPTLMNANFADEVDCPPIEKSTVELFAKSKPELWFQKASDPPAVQDPKEGVVPPRRHWLEVPAAVWARNPELFA